MLEIIGLQSTGEEERATKPAMSSSRLAPKMNVKLERLYVALLELAAHRLKLHQSLLDASVPISEDAFMILLLLHSESPRGVLVKKITHVLSSISPVSYSLKRLSEKGLITMEKGVVDKRCTFVKLTSAGVALIDEVGQDF